MAAPYYHPQYHGPGDPEHHTEKDCPIGRAIPEPTPGDGGLPLCRECWGIYHGRQPPRKYFNGFPS
jgi:hypothetical protein